MHSEIPGTDDELDTAIADETTTDGSTDEETPKAEPGSDSKKGELMLVRQPESLARLTDRLVNIGDLAGVREALKRISGLKDHNGVPKEAADVAKRDARLDCSEDSDD